MTVLLEEPFKEQFLVPGRLVLPGNKKVSPMGTVEEPFWNHFLKNSFALNNLCIFGHLLIYSVWLIICEVHCMAYTGVEKKLTIK